MPVAISPALVSSTNYDEGSIKAAKETLKTINSHLRNPDGSIKSGVFKLVRLKTGYQLRRMQWWNPFHSRNEKEMEETATFIQSLLEQAYPSSLSKSDEKKFSTLRDQAHKDFFSYVTKNKSRITTKQLAQLLSSAEWDELGALPSSWEEHKIIQQGKAIQSDPYSLLFGKNPEKTPSSIFETKNSKLIQTRLAKFSSSEKNKEKTIVKVRSHSNLNFYAFPKDYQNLDSEIETLKSFGLTVEKHSESTNLPNSRLSSRTTLVEPDSRKNSLSWMPSSVVP